MKPVRNDGRRAIATGNGLDYKADPNPHAIDEAWFYDYYIGEIGFIEGEEESSFRIRTGRRLYIHASKRNWKEIK